MTARHRAPAGLLRSSLAELGDLVLGRECAGCGRDRTSWCGVCASALAGAPVRRLLHPPPADGVGHGALAVWSCTDYADPVRAAVVAWKDRGRADLTPVLAQPLRRALLAALETSAREAAAREAAVAGRAAADSGPVLLVPAPSSRRSRRERGHEPVRDLARRCAPALRRRGLDVRVVPALAHARAVRDQAGLAADERSVNLKGALQVLPGWVPYISGRSCVLVDDVVTTGATLLECARALAGAGAAVSAAATVAATRRRITRPEQRDRVP